MSCDALPLSLSLLRDQVQEMLSDESSQCSSTDNGETATTTITNSSSSNGLSKALGTVVIEDGSDSSEPWEISQLHSLWSGVEVSYTTVCVCGGGGGVI